MWDTCSVQLDIRLPRDLAAEVEEVQKSDPEFLSRVIKYGLTRRSIYRQLQRSRGESLRSREEDAEVS